MTFDEKELLQARLQIAAGQTLLEARDLDDKARRLAAQAIILREQHQLIDDALHQIWLPDIEDNEED